MSSIVSSVSRCFVDRANLIAHFYASYNKQTCPIISVIGKSTKINGTVPTSYSIKVQITNKIVLEHQVESPARKSHLSTWGL